MKKPECYSGGRGLKSFLGKTQQINKNEKEKVYRITERMDISLQWILQ